MLFLLLLSPSDIATVKKDKDTAYHIGVGRKTSLPDRYHPMEWCVVLSRPKA